MIPIIGIDKIKRACLTMVQRGWTIKDGIYNIPSEMCCCPLVALAVTEESWEEDRMVANGREVSWALTVSREDVNDFTAGFDHDPQHVPSNVSTTLLGREIRAWVDAGMPS